MNGCYYLNNHFPFSSLALFHGFDLLDFFSASSVMNSQIAPLWLYAVDAVTSSGILKAKQKLGRTFHSDKLGGIAFTKISKLTMCSA